MPLTILEGSTFCVSDELGDISEPTMGFFADDTRFLSRWVLTINGARPLMLSSRKVEYYSAAFFLRNPVVGRPRARRDLDRPRALHRRRDAGASRRLEPRPPPGRVRPRPRDRQRLRRHLRGQGLRLRAGRPRPRRAASRRPCSPLRARRQPVRLHVERQRLPRRSRRSSSPSAARPTDSKVTYRIVARAARDLAPARRRHPRDRRDADGGAARRAPLRRRARARPRFAGRLAAARPAAPRVLGRPLALVPPVGRRPLLAPDGRGHPRARPAPRRRHAVVHDRLRPRHADHVPADAPLRPGAGAERAGRARRAAGARGRPRVGRRAGQDRPRGPPRQGRRGVVPALLRHRRRNAALPDPPLRGLALDRRRRARA